ncbi:MAG: hypothetical protein LBU04_01930 [Christensenellaceae bacterium]|jgi:hypothetical protein|nr:hypothetical protein [Christensenellaceae bacterium]
MKKRKIMASLVLVFSFLASNFVRASDVKVNVLVVGDEGSEKTSLISRIFDGKMSQSGFEGFEANKIVLHPPVPLVKRQLDQLCEGINGNVTHATYNLKRFGRNYNIRFFIREASLDEAYRLQLYKTSHIVIIMIDYEKIIKMSKENAKQYVLRLYNNAITPNPDGYGSPALHAAYRHVEICFSKTEGSESYGDFFDSIFSGVREFEFAGFLQPR